MFSVTVRDQKAGAFGSPSSGELRGDTCMSSSCRGWQVGSLGPCRRWLLAPSESPAASSTDR